MLSDLLQRRRRHIICLAIEPEQQIHARDTTTAKEAWDALKKQFARESILQKSKIKTKLLSRTCKFLSGGNMLAYINHKRSNVRGGSLLNN